MAKVSVPEELQIYLQDVDQILSNARTTKDIEAVTQNIAKFQYYLRGRLDSNKIMQEMLPGEVHPQRALTRVTQDTEALKQISDQLGVLLFALSDELTKRMEHGKINPSTS